MIKSDTNKLLYWISIILFAVFFLGILGDQGPILQKDSYTFIDGAYYIEARYYIYVNILRLCQNIFGENQYLFVVYVIQSLLAFGSAVIFTEYIRKYYQLNYITSFGVYVFSYLPYAYSLPQDVANHHIMTEAITFPLFLLYMMYVYRTFLEKKKRNMFMVAVLTVLIMKTRSQMVLLVVIYILLWIVIGLQKVCEKMPLKKRKWFFYGLAGGVCICIMVGIFLFGKAVAISGNAQMEDAVMGRLLCTVDEEDKNLFEGDDRELFELLYENVEMNQFRYPYFRDNIWKWEDILIATNENTKMYRSAIKQYYIDKGSEKLSESISNSISNILPKLYMQHWDQYVTMTAHLVLQSFVVAVFIHPTAIFTLCYIIAILIYIVTLGTLWFINKKWELDFKYSIPMILTLCIIAILVIITNLLFFGQQRYVVYGFGCFYISWLLMLVGVIRNKAQENSKMI